MGGGGRLDIDLNLIALGGEFDCNCHGEHHAGNQPLRCDLLAIVAKREGCLQTDIERTIHAIRRLPKGTDMGIVMALIQGVKNGEGRCSGKAEGRNRQRPGTLGDESNQQDADGSGRADAAKSA